MNKILFYKFIFHLLQHRDSVKFYIWFLHSTSLLCILLVWIIYLYGTLNVVCSHCLDCCWYQNCLFFYPYAFLYSYLLYCLRLTVKLLYWLMINVLAFWDTEMYMIQRCVCLHWLYKACCKRSVSICLVNCSDLKKWRGPNGYRLA